MQKYDNTFIKLIWCCYICDILSLNVKMYPWLKLYTVPFFVSGQTYKISKGSNNYCSHCISSHTQRHRDICTQAHKHTHTHIHTHTHSYDEGKAQTHLLIRPSLDWPICCMSIQQPFSWSRTMLDMSRYFSVSNEARSPPCSTHTHTSRGPISNSSQNINYYNDRSMTHTSPHSYTQSQSLIMSGNALVKSSSLLVLESCRVWLVFVYTLISATNSDPRNQVNCENCVITT